MASAGSYPASGIRATLKAYGDARSSSSGRSSGTGQDGRRRLARRPRLPDTTSRTRAELRRGSGSRQAKGCRPTIERRSEIRNSGSPGLHCALDRPIPRRPPMPVRSAAIAVFALIVASVSPQTVAADWADPRRFSGSPFRSTSQDSIPPGRRRPTRAWSSRRSSTRSTSGTISRGHTSSCRASRPACPRYRRMAACGSSTSSKEYILPMIPRSEARSAATGPQHRGTISRPNCASTSSTPCTGPPRR